ncbi:uncharacterized protein LOC124192995 [Daphnia pulex]|uniref:uncharacterized protein LOC124192995 n=1 Tax=Daphnia pulex TaxID=6669 RepID=UPI001EDEBC5E|nr:uncharacterized protein LOC124192995 [Daphnia pulex]
MGFSWFGLAVRELAIITNFDAERLGNHAVHHVEKLSNVPRVQWRLLIKGTEAIQSSASIQSCRLHESHIYLCCEHHTYTDRPTLFEGSCLHSSGVAVQCGVLLQPMVVKAICIKLLFLVHPRCWFCATEVTSNIVFNCYSCLCSLPLYIEKEQKK